MFETVATERRDKHVAYETLPISIALHGAAFAAAVIIALWNVVFPTHSPRLMRPYALVSPDPPLPVAIKLSSVAAPMPKVVHNAPEEVAPTVIPDVIPTMNAMRSLSIFEPASQQGGVGDSGGGSADGLIGGALEGVPGGIPLPDDGRVHIDRDKPLPLVAIYREYPDYPERERLAGKQATVVVRYVIGKDGWIRQLDILLHAEQAAFDEATLKALRMWRFQPMLQDGKPVEVVHELTVIYQLAYR